MPESPVVFISYSSGDRERFVDKLEKGLRSKNVRTIYDQRDFTMGSSLTQAMFEEGIAKADAVVIVLSRTYILSVYTTAERDAAVMRRIEEGTRLLVLVLDGLSALETPLELRREIRTYVNPEDEASVQAAIEKTANAAHGITFEQELGPPPAWVIEVLPKVTKDPLDAALLGVAATYALEDETHTYFSRDRFYEEGVRLERSAQDVEDSVSELDRVGLLEAYDWFGAGNIAKSYQATRAGIDRWLSAADRHYQDKLRAVAAALLNEHCRNNHEVAKATGYELAFVNHALNELESQGCVEIRRVAAGGLLPVRSIESALRRFLK